MTRHPHITRSLRTFLQTVLSALMGILWQGSLWAVELPSSRIDLRDWDTSKARELREPWDFYWNILLQPNSHIPLADQQIPVGLAWRAVTLTDGEKGKDTGAASYRTILKGLAPGVYEFWLDDMKSSAAILALDAQGKVLAEAQLGTVGLDAEQSNPARGRLRMTFATNSTEDVTLLLHVANFVRNRGGDSNNPPRLATPAVMTRSTFQPLLGDVFSLGICFAVGIYCLMIFLQNTSEKAPLFLFFLCIATISRLMGTSHLMTYLFPDAGTKLFSFRYTAEYLPMLTASIQLHFIYRLLGRHPDRPSRSLQALDAFAVVSALIILTTPIAIYTRLLPLFEIFLVACSVWLLVFLSRGMRRGVRGLSYLIWGSLILAASVLHDVVVHQQTNILIAPYGSSLFLLLQAQFVAKNLAETLRRSRELAYELQQRQEEILKFNSSLEVLVHQKTRDIRSILESTKVGLFSVDEDLNIHQDYAACLSLILEQTLLKGQSMISLLFDRSDLKADEKDKALAALRFSFGNERSIFEANYGYLPTKIRLRFPHGVKHLELEWSPMISSQNTVERILISLHDVTGTERLQQEAEEGRQELRRLGQIVDIGQQKFERFLKDANQKWELFVHLLRELEFGRKEAAPILQEIYMRLHTLKATSRMLKLQDLADAYHQAEELLPNQEPMEPQEIIRLRHQLTQIRNLQQLYVNSFATLSRSQQEEDPETKDLHPLSLKILLLNLQGFASELAHELGKFDCKLDIDISPKMVLQEDFFHALSSAMVHLIQNAIDHGLESIQERALSGKPAYGTILFFIDEQGRLGMADDGAGLNLKKILQSAEDSELILEDTQSLVEQLFHAGFSTKSEVTATSGRGIGMNAVRLLLQEVGTQIQIVPLNLHKNHLNFYFAIDLRLQKECSLTQIDSPTRKLAS